VGIVICWFCASLTVMAPITVGGGDGGIIGIAIFRGGERSACSFK